MDSLKTTDSLDRSLKKRLFMRKMREVQEIITRQMRLVQSLVRAARDFLDRCCAQIKSIVLAVIEFCLCTTQDRAQVQVWFRIRAFALLPIALSCLANIQSPRGPPSTTVK